MKVWWCVVVVFCGLSACKPQDQKPAYYHVEPANNDVKSRRALCEAQTGFVWRDEVCIDLQAAEQDCNTKKTKVWDAEKKECVDNPEAIQRIRQKTEAQ